MSERLFVITPRIAVALLQRSNNERYYPDRAERLIDACITDFGLAGTGYDPSWIEQRRNARKES